MSLSPESFDRLLADKLSQLPEPDFDPAHWDQLEDQLQHLNQAAQAQQPASAPASAPAPAPVAGGWLAAPLAKIGAVATLAGLTAVSSYLFVASRPTDLIPATQPAVIAASPAPQVVEPAPALTEMVAEDPSQPVATPAPTAPVRRTTRRLTATTVSRQPASAPVAAPVLPPAAPASEPLAVNSLPAPAAPEQSAEPVASPASTVRAAPAGTQPYRADSAQAGRRATEENTLAKAPLAEASGVPIPDVITPTDKDGKNDQFVLPFTPGVCRLTIYDGRGRTVYHSERYDNSWDGHGLPTGTYHYVITIPGPSAWRTTGSVTIQR